MTGPEHYTLAETRLRESESAADRHDVLAATLLANQAETHARLAAIATRLPQQHTAPAVVHLSDH